MSVITVAVHSRSPRLPHVALLAASLNTGYFALAWVLIRHMIPHPDDANALLAVIAGGSVMGIVGNYVIVLHRARTGGNRDG
jgi:hypothetical protein